MTDLSARLQSASEGSRELSWARAIHIGYRICLYAALWLMLLMYLASCNSAPPAVGEYQRCLECGVVLTQIGE